MASTEMHEYELVYILQPNIDQDGINDFNNRLVQTVTNQQGRILATELWGKRNLAYTIKKFGTGYYVLNRFQMAPQGTEELDRLLRFNENVIRYLLMRTDD